MRQVFKTLGQLFILKERIETWPKPFSSVIFLPTNHP